VSTVRDCLFNTYSTISALHIIDLLLHLRMRDAAVTGDSPVDPLYKDYAK
jgi:hypothetical protein